MRSSILFVGMSAAIFSVTSAMAQTSAAATSAPLSKRELRQQDRAECSKLVDRYHANEFLECMANREAARKTAAKEKKAEAKKAAAAEIAVKREKAEQQWQAEQKARADWNQKRMDLLAEQRAKRADCKKQAAQQKLRFVARTEFLEKCIAAK